MSTATGVPVSPAALGAVPRAWHYERVDWFGVAAPGVICVPTDWTRAQVIEHLRAAHRARVRRNREALRRQAETERWPEARVAGAFDLFELYSALPTFKLID